MAWDTLSPADTDLIKNGAAAIRALRLDLQTYLGLTTPGLVNKVAITAPATGATLTLANGSSLITSGAYSVTMTASAATAITLPTTGTLATLAGSETLTNKTIASNGGGPFACGAITSTAPFSINSGNSTVSTIGGRVDISPNIAGLGLGLLLYSQTGASKSTAIGLNGTNASSANVRWYIGPNINSTDGSFDIVTSTGTLAFCAKPTGNVFIGTQVDNGSGDKLQVDGGISFKPATTTSAPAAGGAGALPATPLGYATVTINGTARKIPYYA